MGCEMAKLRRLDISLDSELGVFCPGDIVAGSVCVEVDEDIDVGGCRLVCYGNAQTSWVEVTRKQTTELVTGGQTLFQAYRQLFGVDSAFADGTLRPTRLSRGGHEFPFEFRLPLGLPCSFAYDSEAGRISASVAYGVRAEVENAKRTARHARERRLLVLVRHDLNEQRQLCDGVRIRKELALVCGCVGGGRVVCELALSKTGFVPGETLDLAVQLLNRSARCVRSTHITLQQRLLLTANQRCRDATALIFSISGQRVKPGASGYYHDVIHVPPLPPSGLHGCDIIHIQYVVQVQIEAIDVLGRCKLLEISQNIVIGTEPLRDAFPDDRLVVPCFAHFDFASGDIVEFGADANDARPCPASAYRYFKSEPKALELQRQPDSLAAAVGATNDVITDI